MEHDGILRGGIGEIVSVGHPLVGKWVVFSTRHAAPYDFEKQLGEYNLSIGEGKPTLDESGRPRFPRQSGRSIGYGGFGSVSLAK